MSQPEEKPAGDPWHAFGYIVAGVAFYGFAAFYAVCLGLNWWFYLRRGAEIRNP